MLSSEERAAWLLERQEYVTASDVGALMGMSPHKSRNKLLREKVTRSSEDIDRLAVVMAGKYLEEGIFRWHLAHRGFAGNLWMDGLRPHPTCPNLAATPDGLTTDTLGQLWVTEVKNVGRDKLESAWNTHLLPVCTVVHAPKYMRIDGTKIAPPAYYWAQLQAQMSVLGIQRGRIVVCFGGQVRADLDFRLDEEFESRMMREVGKFWAEVVEGRALLEE